jgi:hypothetical protein
MAATPNWQAFKIQIPGEDLLEGVRAILETLLIFLEILKAILETIKAFLIDFGNPIKALVEALIKLILTLFEALKRTGIYALFDIPNPFVDPKFLRNAGGFNAYTTRFRGSLFDTKDPNRPQPIAGATTSGFVLIVADASDVIGLLNLIKILLKFFGKEFLSPQYAPPSNFKVLPVGAKGDALLSIVSVFQSKPKSLVVEWALPQGTRAGDPGFSDLLGAISDEFSPPNFLIEKNEVNPTKEITDSQLNDDDACGRLTTEVDTNYEVRGQPGKVIQRKIRLNDEYGDPFIKSQKYIVIDTSSNTGTFLLGQLGTFRYIDHDVVPDRTYWYRVRAFSGDLTRSGPTSVQFTKPDTSVVEKTPFVAWPGKVTMGRATPFFRVRMPNVGTFDVIENLKRVFQVAFSFNFHLPPAPESQFDPSGFPLNDTTAASEVGRGSLQKFAGSLVSFEAVPFVGTSISKALTPNEATGVPEEMPWQRILVRSNATRLASIVAGAMLEAGAADQFRAIMQGPPPEVPTIATKLSSSTIEKMVFALTLIQSDGTVSQDTALLYAAAFTDPNVRVDILTVINFIKGFTLGGVPPDWIQISILRDIIPWSGQMLYELIAKIQALLDAFKGMLDEIKNFIDLIIRKINVLEKFIQYLISILDFIASLQAGFFILSVPETDGDAGTWASLVESAGGDKPPSGPSGYTGGIALAYVAVDVGAFVSAFKLIF